ncbi:MAG: hypothetical protein R3B45_16700 [Bdellovibrionota bacterium]
MRLCKEAIFFFMAILTAVSLLDLQANAFAAATNVEDDVKKSELTCWYEEGGYDDESIVVSLENGIIESLLYNSYQGEVGPFVKSNANTFEYTDDSLIINHIISFGPGLKSATLLVVYKDGGSVLNNQFFQCW